MTLVRVLVAFAAAVGAPAAVQTRAPLHDVVSLNIGLNCQWQQKCIARQQRAMNRALKYVDKKQPPAWRIQMCNRNASRSRNRVDWVGFDNCVRNGGLAPAPARSAPRRAKRTSEANSSPAPVRGERGSR